MLHTNSPTSLAEALREQTADEHRETESAPLVRALLRGEVDRSGYAALLAALLPVYRELEQSLVAQSGDPRLSFIDLHALARTPSLEADLRHLDQPRAGAVARDAERSDYVARIRDVAAGEPFLLVAHAYTRYMGDLSGGQIIARIIAKHLGVGPDSGASFFHFPAIDDIDRAKADFRGGLDALRLDEATVHGLVQEAKLSFRLNRLLVDHVGQTLAPGRPA